MDKMFKYRRFWWSFARSLGHPSHPLDSDLSWLAFTYYERLFAIKDAKSWAEQFKVKYGHPEIH